MTYIGLLLFALFGAPLFAVLGSLALAGFGVEGSGSVAVVNNIYGITTKSTLLAIPLFTFAGYLLAESGAPKRLVRVSHALFGWMPGGLAIVALVTCSFFTAFTGASGVTIVALGGVLYPMLMRDNYPQRFNLGLLTSSGSLGLLFPPSLPIILFSVLVSMQLSASMNMVNQADYDAMGNLWVLSDLPATEQLREAIELDPDSQIQQWADLGGTSSMMSSPQNDEFVTASSVNDLFAAGVLPGLLLVLALSGYAVFVARKRKIPTVPFVWKEAAAALWDAKWEIPLPIVILVGIYSGWFTVNQAASVTAMYLLFVEIFVLRDIHITRDLPRIICDSSVLVGGILLILGSAFGLTNFLIDAEVPQKLIAFVSSLVSSKWTFLILLNIFLLLVGAMMDIFSAITVVVPLILPIALSFGVHPAHLGIIFLTNLEIGYSTPPVGLNLFISSFRFNRPVLDLYRATLPFIGLMLLVLLVITYWDDLSLTLVRWVVDARIAAGR